MKNNGKQFQSEVQRAAVLLLTINENAPQDVRKDSVASVLSQCHSFSRVGPVWGSVLQYRSSNQFSMTQFSHLVQERKDMTQDVKRVVWFQDSTVTVGFPFNGDGQISRQELQTAVCFCCPGCIGFVGAVGNTRLRKRNGQLWVEMCGAFYTSNGRGTEIVQRRGHSGPLVRKENLLCGLTTWGDLPDFLPISSVLQSQSCCGSSFREVDKRQYLQYALVH